MNLILMGFLLRIASKAAVEFVTTWCDAFVINFKLLAAKRRRGFLSDLFD